MRRRVSDLRDHTTAELGRKDFFLTSYSSLNIGSLLRAEHYYTTELPDMVKLLDVRDATDPLCIYLGNAGLKTTRRNLLKISHSSAVRKRQRTFNASLSGEWTRHAVASARSYDPQTGVTTHRPRNIDGNWWGRLDAGYGQALDREGKLMFSLAGHAGIKHSVDYSAVESSESVRSAVDNWQLSGETTLTWRLGRGFTTGFKGSVRHMRQRARPLSWRDNESTDLACGLTLTAPLARGFDLETDLMAYTRCGYGDRTMNGTDWVWNAALSYAFGRKKAWLLRAVGFDLLSQLSSVRRELNEQGYTEWRYNTVPAYASLHIVYRLSVDPRRKKGGKE